MPPRPRSDVRTPEQQKSRDGDPRSRDSRNSQVCFSIRSCNHAGHPTPQPLKTTMPSNESNGDFLASRAGQWPPPDPRPSGPPAWTAELPARVPPPTKTKEHHLLTHPQGEQPTSPSSLPQPTRPSTTTQTKMPRSTTTYHATMPTSPQQCTPKRAQTPPTTHQPQHNSAVRAARPPTPRRPAPHVPTQNRDRPQYHSASASKGRQHPLTSTYSTLATTHPHVRGIEGAFAPDRTHARMGKIEHAFAACLP